MSAFVKAFRREMDSAAHGALVETYMWANSMGYEHDPTLRDRAERWAADIEAAGKTMDVLMALSRSGDDE